MRGTSIREGRVSVGVEHVGPTIRSLGSRVHRRTSECLTRRGLQFWSMSTLPLSEAKARLSELAEEVATTHTRLQITKNGRDYVVLLAAEDLESIEATIELLSDPDAQDRVASSEKDIAEGNVLDENAMRAMLSKARGAE